MPGGFTQTFNTRIMNEIDEVGQASTAHAQRSEGEKGRYGNETRYETSDLDTDA